MREHGHESLAAWGYHLLGIVLLWLQAHGLGFLGVASVCYGMVLQYRRYKLAERETEVRIKVLLGQIPPPTEVSKTCRS